MSVVQQKLIKGIVLGGLCSIISLDISEVVSTCLDPVVKRLTTKQGAASFSQSGGVSGANAGRPPILTAAAALGDRHLEKEKKKKKARKVLYKRILRILLFIGVAYVMVAILMQSSKK